MITAVAVGTIVCVGVAVLVGMPVPVATAVAVVVDVAVNMLVGMPVLVAVAVAVKVLLGTSVLVVVAVAVKVLVGTAVLVSVAVGANVLVGVEVGGAATYSASTERKRAYPPEVVTDQFLQPVGTVRSRLRKPGVPVLLTRRSTVRVAEQAVIVAIPTPSPRFSNANITSK